MGPFLVWSVQAYEENLAFDNLRLSKLDDRRSPRRGEEKDTSFSESILLSVVSTSIICRGPFLVWSVQAYEENLAFDNLRLSKLDDRRSPRRGEEKDTSFSESILLSVVSTSIICRGPFLVWSVQAYEENLAFDNLRLSKLDDRRSPRMGEEKDTSFSESILLSVVSTGIICHGPFWVWGVQD